ncbi:hypothetical protein [Bacillus gaemokensis]|uniref:Uncharacterized protein n=1 Tax=Bacillus gaemokensis TaxID=574375 RepID=A0A073KNP0_9BACI|nr:hypothetical protein [Bacillus gaemokensis]KEK23963.1 hypothetical protein BAGA_06015 [Bacillus gaemokensis]KYG38084.1 hypothetical protein AZF08_20245 [Bacillus gaemokensis]
MGLELEHLRLKDIVRRAEIKRIAENLSKRELCYAFKINYTYYNNCVTMRDLPSPQMVQMLEEYLKTQTLQVYKLVFEYRSSDVFVGNRSSDKFVKREGKWKENFHRSTGVEDGDYEKYVKEMRENDILED